MVQFKNLALNDVNFGLCTRQVPLDEFNVLVCRECVAGSGVSGQSPVIGRVAIIGQSHLWQLSYGEDAFSEVMLCVPHDLTAYHPVCRATSLTEFQFSTVNGSLKYATRVTTRRAASPEMWSTLTQIAGPYDDAVEFQFPQGDMPLAPVTSLAWRIDKNGFVIRSIHTFPAESAIVKTETRINWGDLV